MIEYMNTQIHLLYRT